ncbi:MAG: hypothetical protein NC240_10850 [Clostridium sp.]|nr:hypothetical protein [Clostridium sp.]
MKNKKNYLIVCLMLVVLTACSKETKDFEIKQEIGTEARKMIDSDETITNIEIIEKDFGKKEEYGKVYCKLVSEKAETQYIRYLEAIYTHEKKYGWILGIVNKVDEEKWEVVPLTGINENKIIDLLDGESITINGDVWDLTENNIISFTIENHDTFLENKKDTIKIVLTIDDYIQQAKGELTVNFVFDDEWKIDTIDGKESFSNIEKDGFTLNLSDEDLIEEIIKEEIKYGASKTDIGSMTFTDHSTEQLISISQDEISDFIINSEETTSKGMYKEYDCNFTLTKKNAVFDVNAVIKYEYISDQGWTNIYTDIMPKIEDLDISGDWIGTYNGLPYDGDCVLSINTIDDYGNIIGVYSYAPDEQSMYESGCFNVSGTIDMTTLFINLSPGDWVVEPDHYLSVTKVDITAYLMVDEATMYGSGQEGAPFIITRD